MTTGLTWDALFFSGSVVGLHSEKWGARLLLKPQDLGIDNSVQVSQALSLGAHRLAPAVAFAGVNKAIAKARRELDSYSMSFSFIFGARYVPERNFEKVQGILRACKAEFEAAVDAFVADYERMKGQMLPILQAALAQAAKTPEAAEAAFQRIQAEYPAADVIRKRFVLTWKVYAIQGPNKAGAAAALEEEKETVRDVVGKMVRELRDEATTKLGAILQLIQKGGKLYDKSVESALAVLDHIDRVNVLGDSLLTEQVAKLRSALKNINLEERVPDQTVAGLDAIKQALETDVAQAVAAAEAKLSGLGRRKLGGRAPQREAA